MTGYYVTALAGILVGCRVHRGLGTRQGGAWLKDRSGVRSSQLCHTENFGQSKPLTGSCDLRDLASGLSFNLLAIDVQEATARGSVTGTACEQKRPESNFGAGTKSGLRAAAVHQL